MFLPSPSRRDNLRFPVLEDRTRTRGAFRVPCPPLPPESNFYGRQGDSCSVCHLQPHCCPLESERKRQEGEGIYIYIPVPLPYFVFPRVFVLCLCISSFPTPPSSEHWAGCAFILEQCLQQSRCPEKCPVRSGSLPFVPNEALSVR